MFVSLGSGFSKKAFSTSGVRPFLEDVKFSIFLRFRILDHVGERQSIAQKGVRAIDARNSQLDMAQMLQNRMVVLPGCQRMSVNTFLCDTLGLADHGLASAEVSVRETLYDCISRACVVTLNGP